MRDSAGQFRDRFVERLSAHADEHPTGPISTAVVPAEHDVGDHSRGDLDLLVATVPPDANPLTAVDGAPGAVESDPTAVATCNATDCFLHDGRDAPYYLDLRDRSPDEAARDLLEAAATYAETGRLPAQRARERVAGVLRSFYAATWPRLGGLAREAAERDDEFATRFEAWAEGQGGIDAGNDPARDERFDLAARRYAYLLAAGALHGAIGDGTESTAGDDPHALVGGLFDSLADDSGIGLFEAFPLDDRTARGVEDLQGVLRRCSLDAVDGDLLGDIYEDLLPAAERKAHGQFYTPATIAEIAVRWALPGDECARASTRGDGLPRVLDPAAGTGTFAVQAYRRLAELDSGADHGKLLDRVVAVDVNRVPLLTTALNLACRDGTSPNSVRTVHASFLDLDPGDLSAGEEGDAGWDECGHFDAVVGNPPFVRQEHLDKDHYRRHLDAFGEPGGTADDAPTVSAKSDAYVYFVTQATRFLRTGGRLAFVVPTKWMMTDYGRSFQQFLFEHYRLAAVVGFDARAFDDALVDAALLLAERRPDSDRRADAVTRFVRLDESMAVGDVLDAVERDDSDAVEDDSDSRGGGDGQSHSPAGGEVVVETRPTHRTVALRQATAAAAEAGKLAHYLSAPALAIELLRHPDLVRLGDLVAVAYGNKTGANRFFFLDGDDRRRWPIDDRFLTPAIRSVRGVESRVLTADATDQYLLDVRPYVETVRDSAGDGLPVERVKRSLARDGYDALLSYVEHGEREGYHERRTCAARDVWFDLGDLVRPEIVHPKFFDDRVVPLWNRDRLAPSNAVDGLALRQDLDELVVLGLLHSTVHQVLLECWGRAEGGGALQLMTYEMETLPAVDPATLGGDRRAKLVEAIQRLLAGDESARRDLDGVVLDALGLDLGPAELRSVREALARRRRGNGTAPPVERLDDVGTRRIGSDGR